VTIDSTTQITEIITLQLLNSEASPQEPSSNAPPSLYGADGITKISVFLAFRPLFVTHLSAPKWFQDNSPSSHSSNPPFHTLLRIIAIVTVCVLKSESVQPARGLVSRFAVSLSMTGLPTFAQSITPSAPSFYHRCCRRTSALLSASSVFSFEVLRIRRPQ
jgi:hypothetical protein